MEEKALQENRGGSFRERLTLSAVFLYLAYVLLPMMPVTLPALLRYAMILFFSGGAYLGTALLGRREFLNSTIRLLGILIFIYIIYVGNWQNRGMNFISYFVNAFLFWIPLLLMPGVAALNDQKKKKIMSYIIVLYFITMITTIIGNMTYINAARILATGGSSGNGSQLNFYSRMNIGGYGFIYSLIVLFPVVFQLIQHSKQKNIYRLFCVVASYTVIITQYSLAVIAMFVCIVCALLFRKKRTVVFWCAAVLVFLLFLLVKDSMVVMLFRLERYLNTQELFFLSDRLGSIADVLTDGTLTGGIADRQRLYERGWNSFCASPVLGNLWGNCRAVSAHSDLIDILAASGVAGLVLFLVLMGNYYPWVRQYDGTGVKNTMVSSLLLFGYIMLFNTVFTSSEIAAVLFLYPVLVTQDMLVPIKNRTGRFKMVWRRRN